MNEPIMTRAEWDEAPWNPPVCGKEIDDPELGYLYRCAAEATGECGYCHEPVCVSCVFDGVCYDCHGKVMDDEEDEE